MKFFNLENQPLNKAKPQSTTNDNRIDMRFNLDEALDATTDEEVPTNLESLPSDDDDEELKLDDDFLTMLSNLNLKTRLPQWDMHCLLYTSRCV